MVIDFVEDAQSEETILLFLMREGLLDQENAKDLLETYSSIDNTEAITLLLEYIHDKFGTGSINDITF